MLLMGVVCWAVFACDADKEQEYEKGGGSEAGNREQAVGADFWSDVDHCCASDDERGRDECERNSV